MIYSGIRVRDMNRSVKFYTEGLGMKLVGKPRKWPTTRGLFAYLKSSGSAQLLELNWYPKWYAGSYHNGDELDHLGFVLGRTESIDEKVNELKRKGARVALAAHDAGKVRLAFLKDPDGVWIELIGRQRKKRSKS